MKPAATALLTNAHLPRPPRTHWIMVAVVVKRARIAVRVRVRWGGGGGCRAAGGAGHSPPCAYSRRGQEKQAPVPHRAAGGDVPRCPAPRGHLGPSGAAAAPSAPAGRSARRARSDRDCRGRADAMCRGGAGSERRPARGPHAYADGAHVRRTCCLSRPAGGGGGAPCFHGWPSCTQLRGRLVPGMVSLHRRSKLRLIETVNDLELTRSDLCKDGQTFRPSLT